MAKIKIKMDDNSLSPRIYAGDTLIVDKNTKVTNGAVMMIQVGENIIFRRASECEGGMIYTPINLAQFNPVFVPDGQEVKVFGRVVGVEYQ